MLFHLNIINSFNAKILSVNQVLFWNSHDLPHEKTWRDLPDYETLCLRSVIYWHKMEFFDKVGRDLQDFSPQTSRAWSRTSLAYILLRNNENCTSGLSVNKFEAPKFLDKKFHILPFDVHSLQFFLSKCILSFFFISKTCIQHKYQIFYVTKMFFSSHFLLCNVSPVCLQFCC